MTPTPTMRLCDIAAKPGISASTQLITTRRICRNIGRNLDSIQAERRALRRQAGKLKAFLPFTRQAIADLEQRAQTHRSDERDKAVVALAGFGQSLLFDHDGLASALGFERLCDLLSVNTVEREQARREGVTNLEGLVFTHALEDSAERRAQEWNDAPLFNACHAAMADFIRDCPDGVLPDPFAPGAPFGPKLSPKLRVV
ncbi:MULTISPECIES: hypothetical protein [unclassified Pseudomonas]|uniref:hypothetical protein n=1 Tax=unclassified Pseudomonas TaxID=196821 RepID=UPI000BD64194|nr:MULTISPECIES: hypothetical protein [unclassified Pseudomonas]PXX58613.1 hypothetical protein D906_05130 [Pseudomonas sp. LAIL14HWK12:I1]SOD00128.1 hypothetical protein SAMN05660198_05185 [Pseudomonas sp. LAIL14HWK12:I3]